MPNNINGILIGGILPAIFFGTSTIFLKASNKSGISLNYYLLFAGIGVVFISLLSFIVFKEQIVNPKSAFYSSILGVLWSGGVILMAMGVTKYGIPVSILAPIVATNSLVTVVLGFLIYSEWRDLNIVRLSIGALFIIIGGILVAQSQ